jgi:hypothetical protein
MNEQILDEVVARRFWLGQLSPEEQGRIEELAFDDPQWFAFLQAAEDDLIDEFVSNDLSSEEKTLFEKHFLAQQPELREDVEVARAMRKYFERQPVVPSLWERFRKWIHVAVAMPFIPATVKAAAIILAAGFIGLVLLPKIIGPGSGPPRQAQQQQTPESPALPAPTSAPTEAPAQPAPSPVHKDNQNTPPVPPRRPIYALLLPGASPRSGDGTKSVSITPGRPTDLGLLLVANTPRRSYQAALERRPVNGPPIQTWSTLTPQKTRDGNVIHVQVSPDLLKTNQSYRIVVNGVTANGDLERVDVYQFKTQ